MVMVMAVVVTPMLSTKVVVVVMVTDWVVEPDWPTMKVTAEETFLDTVGVTVLEETPTPWMGSPTAVMMEPVTEALVMTQINQKTTLLMCRYLGICPMRRTIKLEGRRGS
jgi:hypothetical protein